MKIVCITPLDTSSVTVRARIIPLLSRLGDKGHEITLIAPNANYFPQANIAIRSAEGEFYSFSKCYIRFPRNLLVELKKNCDLIYVHRADLHSAIFGIAFSRTTKLPLVVDVDDYETSSFPVYGMLKETIMKFLVKKADGIVAASQEIYKFCKEGRGSKGNVFYIPNSVDLYKLDPTIYRRNERRGEITFIWVGALYPYVNWPLIIRAFASMKNEAKLKIVGDGPAKVPLEREIAELGIRDRVNITGRVPYEEIPKILVSGDIGLLPLYDNKLDKCKCPIKLFEYMAMELPIISVNVGEPAYVINRAGCGIVTHINYEKFANAMDVMVKNIGSWKERGKLGRKYLEKFQNWDILSNKLETALIRVLKQKRA